MKITPKTKNKIASKSALKRSEFAQSALALDEAFESLFTISGQIDRLSIESDSGLEKAKELLLSFSTAGENIGPRIQLLAKTLEAARIRAEDLSKIVMERAVAVRERQQNVDQMMSRFQAVADMVAKVTETVALIQKPKQGKLTAEERVVLIGRLPEIGSKLNILIDETQKLKADAESSKMGTLKRNAETLAQQLHSVRSRIDSISRSPLMH